LDVEDNSRIGGRRGRETLIGGLGSTRFDGEVNIGGYITNNAVFDEDGLEVGHL
jgi:hypothetical protein